MKARIVNPNRRKTLTEKDIEIVTDEVQKQVAERYNEIQAAIQKDIAVQYIATVMYTLETWYGWGKKRQRQFFERVQQSYEDMNGVAFVPAFNADDLTERIKNKFDIDLKEEIQIEFK